MEDLCYNKINGCTNTMGCESHVAFCSDKCWREYNDIKDEEDAVRKKYNGVANIQKRCAQLKRKALKDKEKKFKEDIKIFDGGL